MSNKTQILVVDDHPIFYQGLKQLINQEADLTVCDQAGNVAHALEKIEALKPDLVIVDISLEESNDGLELLDAH